MTSYLRRSRGFTLIELMAVVTILAIIAAVAIPNYTSYVTRSKRTSAKTVLLDIAAQLERNYTTNGCYNKATVAACQAPASAGNDVAVGTRAPLDGRATHIITTSFANGAGVVSGQVFTLTATPCGTAGNCAAGSETTFVDAECGAFTLAGTGQRGLVIGGAASTDNALIARCWQR